MNELYVNYASTKLFLLNGLVQDARLKKEHVNKYSHPSLSLSGNKSDDSIVMSVCVCVCVCVCAVTRLLLFNKYT